MTKQLFLLLLAVLVTQTATPILAATDISGTWDMVWDTEGGIRRSNWKISQDGESLTVEFDDNVLKGTFKAKRMEVKGKLYAAEAGYSADFTVEGTVQEDGTLKGSGAWDLYPMTFTAKRAE